MDDIVIVGNTKEEKDGRESSFTALCKTLGVSLECQYDRLQWIWYLCDVSGSMFEGIQKYSTRERYLWPDQMIADARKILAEKIAKGELFEQPPAAAKAPAPGFNFSADPDDPDAVDTSVFTDVALPDLNPFAGLPVELIATMLVDDMVKDFIILGKCPEVGMPPDRSEADKLSNLTKLEMMKECAKEFLKKRFEKFPDASVGVLKFETRATMVSVGEDETATLNAVQKMGGGGGTDICAALEAGLSKVNAVGSLGIPHHFILVSDGMDGGVRNIIQLFPQFKKQNVVLDVIFIVGKNDGNKQLLDTLTAFAKSTGGVVEIVNSESGFRTKFLAVSERKLLTQNVGV